MRQPPLGLWLIIVCTAPAAGQTFVPLGDFGGGTFESRASAVSRDGRTVVGSGHSDTGLTAFRWTATDGLTPLPVSQGSLRPGAANAVSDDGRTIVGMLGSGDSPRAFVWTIDDGGNQSTRALPELEGYHINSIAYGLSGDGRYAVGESHVFAPAPYGHGAQAAIWDLSDESPSVRGLGFLTPGGIPWSNANDISGDGRCVVGDGREFVPGSNAFRMDRDATVMSSLDHTNFDGHSEARATNFDGSVVVGIGTTRGFRWQAGRFTVLDPFQGQGMSLPGGISDDGGIVVGWTFANATHTACVWDADGHVRSLSEILLTEFGVAPAGWSLTFATDVSGDGRTIVGWGINPDGQSEAFLATIPGPATAPVLAVGTAWWSRRGRRRR